MSNVKKILFLLSLSLSLPPSPSLSLLPSPLHMQVAEVGGNSIPEPFDVRTEHAVEARALNFDEASEVGTELGVSNGEH